MATDNRHRPGFPLRCTKCNRTGHAQQGRLVRTGSVEHEQRREIRLHCAPAYGGCGNRWVSSHREAWHVPTAADRERARRGS